MQHIAQQRQQQQQQQQQHVCWLSKSMSNLLKIVNLMSWLMATSTKIIQNHVDNYYSHIANPIFFTKTWIHKNTSDRSSPIFRGQQNTFSGPEAPVAPSVRARSWWSSEWSATPRPSRMFPCSAERPPRVHLGRSWAFRVVGTGWNVWGFGEKGMEKGREGGKSLLSCVMFCWYLEYQAWCQSVSVNI